MNHTLFSILNILIYSTKPHNVLPNWPGSFSTTTECDRNKCCCIYGLLTLSKVDPNYLRIQSQLEGNNCPVNHKIDSTVTMPTGFQTELFLMGGQVDITLSEDSRSIKLENQNAPACSGTAIRNHAESIQSINRMNIILIIVTIFIEKNIFHFY